MADMHGQVALVTGGIRGIGIAICERLMNRGVTVAAGYSANVEAARLFSDKYAEYGATVHQGNIGRNEDCVRVIGEVIDRHGQLDILVNNAGITVDKTVRKMTPDEWDGCRVGGKFRRFKFERYAPAYDRIVAGQRHVSSDILTSRDHRICTLVTIPCRNSLSRFAIHAPYSARQFFMCAHSAAVHTP
jgi:hypothetical protein